MFGACKLLGYIDIHSCRHHASTCAEPVEDIEKLYSGPEAGIDDGFHGLPEHIKEADTSSVCVSLGYQNQYGLPQFQWHLTSTPQILDYFHELHPPSRFGGYFYSLSWIGLTEPHLEVFCVKVYVAACVVWAEASYQCLHLHLSWYPIINLEGVNLGEKRTVRGVRVLPLVECGVFLCGFIHVVPGGVGRSGRCVAVPAI